MIVRFLHPTNSSSYEADVDGQCTGAVALQGLIDNKFLDASGTYDLSIARTKAPVGPNATLAACGVQDGEVINVLHRGIGAQSNERRFNDVYAIEVPEAVSSTQS